MGTLGRWTDGKVNTEFWNAVCARDDVAEDTIVERAAKLLRSGGADVNTERLFEHNGVNWGTVSATFAAITMNKVGVATFLIEQPGVRLDGCYSPRQWTVLHQAVRQGQTSVVTAILKRADVAGLLKAEDDHGRTALHKAAEDARSDIALVLLSSGAIVDAPDIDGLTPLHTLVWNASHSDDAVHVLDTAKCLLDYGADPNSQDRFGDRPIHDAARMEIPADAGDDGKRYLKELVMLLLEYDADLDAVNNNEETPRSLLQKYDKDEEFIRRISGATLPGRSDSKRVCGPGREYTCGEFHAVVGLFGETKKVFSKSVYDLVYKDDEVGPENSDSHSPLEWRWIHFPANNDYVWRLTESWGDDKYRAKDAQAAHDWPMKRRAAAGPSPLGRDPKPDPPNDDGQRGFGDGQERTKIPFFDFEGQDFLDYRDEEFHKLTQQKPKEQFEQRKIRQLQKVARLLDRYPMLERQDGVQQLETLDEFYYDVLTLESLRERDRDQVVWRWLSSRVPTKETKSANLDSEGAPPASRHPRKRGLTRVETHKILVAHQLWIWKIDERTVITALPERWHVGREKTLLDLIRQNCVSTTKDPDTFIESLLKECAYFLERFEEAGLGEHILEIFSGSMALESHAEVRCFSGLAKYLERSRIKKPLHDVASGRMLTTKPSDRQNLEGEDPTSIVEEFEIARNLKDIIDELRTIEHMFKTQETVIRAYCNIMSPAEEDRRRRLVEGWHFEGHLEKTRKLSEEAKRILVDLDRIIQVKQAAFAADEAGKSLKLNAYIMTFTIVTIIFTPLSFMTSLFALSLDWFPRNENGDVNFESPWIMSRMLTGELTSLAVIIVFAVFFDQLQKVIGPLVPDIRPYRRLPAWLKGQQPAAGAPSLMESREEVGGGVNERSFVNIFRSRAKGKDGEV
ncbi:hypothetical protein DL768_010945 [Monosporascus sp. mg162]|nr:hypothetical protein DL768_010945 [Monosporascus sp. mg162]